MSLINFLGNKWKFLWKSVLIIFHQFLWTSPAGSFLGIRWARSFLRSDSVEVNEISQSNARVRWKLGNLAEWRVHRKWRLWRILAGNWVKFIAYFLEKIQKLDRSIQDPLLLQVFLESLESKNIDESSFFVLLEESIKQVSIVAAVLQRYPDYEHQLILKSPVNYRERHLDHTPHSKSNE